MSESLVHWLTAEEFQHKRVSFAQNFEDILLSRVFPNATGLYVDVGANHPVFHSVTNFFYERGWSGINIEPQPRLHQSLVELRPRDINLCVGVSDVEGSLSFYEVPTAEHGYSTFHPGAAEAYRNEGREFVVKNVPVRTLASIFEQYVQDQTIDFLKIDAECFELEVLRGGDWTRWRPRVILIEATIPDLVQKWEPILPAINYQLACFDGLNRYYVREEDKQLVPILAVPVNSLDNAISYEVARLVGESFDLERHQRINPNSRAFGVAKKLLELEKRHTRLAAATRWAMKRVG